MAKRASECVDAEAEDVPVVESIKYLMLSWRINSCFKSLNFNSLPSPTRSRNTSNATSRTVHFVSRYLGLSQSVDYFVLASVIAVPGH